MVLVALLFTVIMGGSTGYHLLLGWSWLDSLYMTIITISTVGFSEVHQLDTTGKILTMALMITSVVVVAFSITTLASLVVDMQIGRVFWRRKMDNKIEELHDHFIICGYGRTGKAVCDQLERDHEKFVVLENQHERTETLTAAERLFIAGDATTDECLQRAGITRAKGLVAALGNDAENVYLVLSARQLRTDLRIASWASSVEAERKVLRAGADYTISPYVQGGTRLAHHLTSPHTMEFLDHAITGRTEIRLGEIRVPTGSGLSGKTIQETGFRRELGVIVIGIRRPTGEFLFNPRPDDVLQDNDILIGIGGLEQLQKMKRMV